LSGRELRIAAMDEMGIASLAVDWVLVILCLQGLWWWWCFCANREEEAKIDA
jgi:hypothetical protein